MVIFRMLAAKDECIICMFKLGLIQNWRERERDGVDLIKNMFHLKFIDYMLDVSNAGFFFFNLAQLHLSSNYEYRKQENLPLFLSHNMDIFHLGKNLLESFLY